MTGFLWNLASFVVALGILVTVHEFGHFWVARRCNVKVLRFSIGFGKSLFSWKGKTGTEYVIAAIPLGGYVRMLDERVDEVSPEERDVCFNDKSVWQRIAILAAGPMANFIFAIFAYWCIYLIGAQAIKPVIGELTPGSFAEKSMLEPGSEIVMVDNKSMKDWNQVSLALVEALGEDAVTVTLKQDGRITPQQYTLNIKGWTFDPDKQDVLTSLGIVPFRPEATQTIGRVSAGTPGEKAGLRKGDVLIGIDNQKAENWQQVQTWIAQKPNENVTLMVEREGDVVALPATLAQRNDKGFLGVSVVYHPWPEDMIVTLDYGPLESVLVAAEQTWRLTELSVKMIGKLLTGTLSVKNLSGPISIAQGAGYSAGFGLVAFLSFLALISVNLGVINLLPLPVLDGGHLLYYLIELLTGRPVPEKIQEVGFKVGAMLLMTMMGIAIFNDLARL